MLFLWPWPCHFAIALGPPLQLSLQRALLHPPGTDCSKDAYVSYRAQTTNETACSSWIYTTFQPSRPLALSPCQQEANMIHFCIPMSPPFFFCIELYSPGAGLLFKNVLLLIVKILPMILQCVHYQTFSICISDNCPDMKILLFIF